MDVVGQFVYGGIRADIIWRWDVGFIRLADDSPVNVQDVRVLVLWLNREISDLLLITG